MANLYATYKDQNNNLQQVLLTSSALNDCVYSVQDVAGEFTVYAWRDSSNNDRIYITHFRHSDGEKTAFTDGGAGYTTSTFDTNEALPLMLCLTRDGNTLYLASSGQKSIFKYTMTTVGETVTAQRATSANLVAVSTNIVAMKMGSDGKLVVVGKSNIFNRYDSTNNDTRITTNLDLTTAMGTANLEGTYINMPIYLGGNFGYGDGFTSEETAHQNIIVTTMWSTLDNDTFNPSWVLVFIDLDHSTTKVFSEVVSYLTETKAEYRPFSTGTDFYKFGADIIVDVFGSIWLAHTTRQAQDVIFVKRCELVKFVRGIYTLTPTIEQAIALENFVTSNTTGNISLNNLNADSNGNIYYCKIPDTAQLETTGKIIRYRADGGVYDTVSSNKEVFLNRSYTLTFRNDITGYDNSNDGCAGR